MPVIWQANDDMIQNPRGNGKFVRFRRGFFINHLNDVTENVIIKLYVFIYSSLLNIGHNFIKNMIISIERNIVYEETVTWKCGFCPRTL